VAGGPTPALAQRTGAVLVRLEVGEALSRPHSFLHCEELPGFSLAFAPLRQLVPLAILCIDDGIYFRVLVLVLVFRAAHYQRVSLSADRVRSNVWFRLS